MNCTYELESYFHILSVFLALRIRNGRFKHKGGTSIFPFLSSGFDVGTEDVVNLDGGGYGNGWGGPRCSCFREM